MTPLRSSSALAMQLLTLVLLINASPTSDTVTPLVEISLPPSSVQQSLTTTRSSSSSIATQTTQATMTTTTSTTTTQDAYYYYYYEGHVMKNVTPAMNTLIATWCLPNFNFPNTTDPYKKLLNAQLSLCEAYIEYFATGVTQWGMDHMVALFTVYLNRFVASNTYLNQQLSSNATISRAFLNEHCTNLVVFEASNIPYGLFWGLISVPGLLPSEESDRLSFLHLFFAPLSAFCFYLSLSVLLTLKKQEPEFSSIILFKAEVVTQYLGYLTFFLGPVTWTDVLFYVPFCFISPTLALNIRPVYDMVASAAIPYLYIWVYQALVRVGIALDRVLAMTKPVWYHIHVKEKKIRKCFFILSMLYWCLCVGFVCGMVGKAYSQQSTVWSFSVSQYTYLDESVAAFGLCIPVAFMVYAVLMIVLAVKMCKKSVAVAGSLVQKQRKLTVMVMSTSVVYFIAYVFEGAFILIYVCNDVGSGGTASFCLSKAVLAELAPFSFVLWGLLPIILDLCFWLCFVMQCICSTMFRDALHAWFVSSLLGRCYKAVVNRGNAVVPVGGAQKGVAVATGIGIGTGSRGTGSTGVGSTFQAQQSAAAQQPEVSNANMAADKLPHGVDENAV